MKQKTRSKEEWKRLVGEYRESGKSLREWCSERGINQKTMSNHTPLYPRANNPQNVHRSEGEWLALIQEQRTSGKSRERWCNENNINHKSMGSAEKRYASQLENISIGHEILESDTRNREITNEPFVKSETPGWIEIGVDAKQHNPQVVVQEKKSKIRIRCGKLEIEADADYPLSHLENLIEKLVVAC